MLMLDQFTLGLIESNLQYQHIVSMSSEEGTSVARLKELNSHNLLEINHEEVPSVEDKMIEKEKMIKVDIQAPPNQPTAPQAHQEGQEHQEQHERCSHKGHNHKHQHGKPGKKNYMIIVYTVFTCLSCLYLETQELNPYIGDSKAQLMSYICVLDVFLCLWSYYQTITIDSSVEKIAVKEHYPYKNLPVKKCEKCNYIKAPRVSHCSTCGKCIYKLDHHCMWTQTCIGYRNQRPFYLFTLYMMIGVLQFWYSTARVVSHLSNTCHFFGAFEPGVYILWVITCISAGVVGAMIIMLWVGHSLMVATNFTTLDNLKEKRMCPIPFIEFRSRYHTPNAVNIYDRGEVKNLKSLFGTNILTCWLPFGREIQNQFIFQPMSPYVSLTEAPKVPVRVEKQHIEKKMKGKIVSLCGEKIAL